MVSCDFCGSTTHREERCYERLQIEDGGKCPRCDTAGHYWKKCPNVSQLICSFCKGRGHFSKTCHHLRKVIGNRPKRKDGQNQPADLDKNWRAKNLESSDEPSRFALNRKQSASAIRRASNGPVGVKNNKGRNLNVEPGSVNPNGLSRFEKSSKSEIPRNLESVSRKNSIDQNASVSFEPDGRVTIQANATQIMELLAAMQVNKQNSTTDTPTSDAEGPSEQPVPSPSQVFQQVLQMSLQANTLNGPASPESLRDQGPTPEATQISSPISNPTLTVETASVKQKVTQTPADTPLVAGPSWIDDRESHLTDENYIEKLQLFYNDLWPTFSPFECPRCNVHVDSFGGVKLKNCQIHQNCRECLKTRILDSPFKEVTCPQYAECMATISEAEIMELLTKEEERRSYETKPLRNDAESDTSLLQAFLLDRDLVPNLKAFECPVCLEEIPPLEGVMPKNCGAHTVCKDCLGGAIVNSDTALVTCPAEGCEAHLQDREIQMLVSPEDHQDLLKKGLKHAIAQAMHCMTPDCTGVWFVSVEGDGRIECPECEKLNCSKCKVIHEDQQSCREYQADLAIKRQNELSEDESKTFLEARFRDGFAMICPSCKAIVEKVDGCDGILCTACRTELCWATKGLRWGPGGKGDWQGGGCRCWVGGKKCAPHCQNCH